MQCLSPYTVLEKHAADRPNAQAIVIGDTKVGYDEFVGRVTGFASWLLHHGFTPGGVSGLCIRDEVGHLIAATALLCLGSPHMSLGSHETGATKRALARKVDVKQLIVEKREEWMEGLTTIVLPNENSVAVMAARSDIAIGSGAWGGLDSICVYLNTSGSTNIPKTFGLSLRRVFNLTKRYADDPRERRSMRTGSIEFDAHRLHRICSLMAGNSCIFLPHVSLRNLVDLCETAAVSSLQMGAYKLATLVRSEGRSGARLPASTAVLTGGSRVPGRLRKELKASLTDNLFVLYATSEVGMISLASPDQHDRFPEGVGFPAAGVTVEILGPGGEPVTPGEIGEIRLCKDGMANGYVAESEKSRVFSEGWFYPRDLVSRRDGEPLIFHGRADDVMILNGINIYPNAIEDALESHPDVREAVAYPIKSRIHGQIPVAAVVLNDGSQQRSVSHLMDLCRQVLGIRAPRQILVVDRIPRNSAGKPLRRELAMS